MERLRRYPGRTLIGAVVIAAGVALLMAANAGLADVAEAFGRVGYDWLVVAAGAQFVAFVGYTLAYRRVLAAFGGLRLSP